MTQFSAAPNMPYVPVNTNAVSLGTLSFFPHNFYGSVSLLTVNIPFQMTISSLGDIAVSCSLGLYSLNQSTLSLANSLSATYSVITAGGNATQNTFLSFTATSIAQNITPGTWFWGIVASSTTFVGGSANIYGAFTVNPANAFPGGFIGGRMTDSTNNLPTAYSISDLDTTGNDAMFVPFILVNS